jgi:predicted acetyltransferase
MNVDFEPFIGAVYTDPKYRGRRISEKLCNVAEDYVKSLGFQTVYICSGEEGLYEKYGYEAFTTIDRPWGVDTIFRKALK